METVLHNNLASPYVHAELPGIIFSAQFWTDLSTLISVVKPIAIAISKFEGDSCISNVYKTWKSLEDLYGPLTPSTIPENIKSFVRVKLNERWNLMQDPIHTLSYLFDPRSHDDTLDELFRRNGISVIKKLVDKSRQSWLETAYLAFRLKAFPYDELPGEPVTPDTCPIMYWKHLSDSNQAKDLAAIALTLLQFPQSSASVERSFSAVRRVHTWQRASLGREKLAKMIYVYFNCAALRGIN